MDEITHCCGCISLRTGTLAIGVLNLIGNVVFLIALIVDTVDIFNMIHAERGLEATFVLLLLFCVLQIIYDILLIIGAEKRRAGYVARWMVFNILDLVMCTIGFVVYSVFVSLVNVPGDVQAQIFILSIVGFVIYLGVSIYFLAVVFSFYKSITNSYSYREISEAPPGESEDSTHNFVV